MISFLQQSKYCWIVAAACCWTNFCLLGVLRSSAVTFVALVEIFDLTRENAAWPSGIFGFCMCITGILSGYINQYYSNRTIMLIGAVIASLSVSLCSVASNITQITVLYGAFQGIGIGAIVPMTHVTINQYFHQYKALATGIAYAGSSIGSFLFPVLSHYILEEFGLTSTFLLLGGIMLQSLIGISFLKPTPKLKNSSDNLTSLQEFKNVIESNETDFCSSKEETETYLRISCQSNHGLEEKPLNVTNATIFSETSMNCKNENSYFWTKLSISLRMTMDILTNWTFLIISATFAIYFSISAIFLMVVLDFAMDKNLSRGQGVSLVSTFSFGDLAGRLLCGWLGDLSCMPRKYIVCIYLAILSCLIIIFPIFPEFYFMVFISVFLGIVNGGIMVNYSAILNEHMGIERLPLTVGFSSCIIGITAFLRPIVIGYFRDEHQSYYSLYQFLGGIQLLITLIWLSKEIVQFFQLFFKNFKLRKKGCCK